MFHRSVYPFDPVKIHWSISSLGGFKRSKPSSQVGISPRFENKQGQLKPVETTRQIPSGSLT